jgi:hypothetical protein
VSASRIISELNHAARIASLEYGLAKIPCLPDCVCLQSCARFYVFLCSSIQEVAIRIWLSPRLCSIRDNPWELLVIAALIFIRGIIMLLQEQPMVAFPQRMVAFPQASRGGVVDMHAIEVISPKVAHMFGVLAIALSSLIVVLYFWARVAIARDPGPNVVAVHVEIGPR